MDNRPLLEKLSQSFHRDDLIAFLRAKSGKFKPEKADYSHYLENASKIKDLYKLGRIDFEDGRRLIMLAGEFERELTSRSSKQAQYDIAKNVLKTENLDAGIFVFHDRAGHFRFSWITAQYTGTRREFSSFRRYTYFVSPDQPARTFVEQIGKADFASIENITEAFSVEPVTKEFFKTYRRIFEEAEKSIDRDWPDDKKRLYTQRFFNRLMFITFLERKGWLAFHGRPDYLRALFDDYWRNDPEKRREANFHRKRLNTLFFLGLNFPSGDKRNDPDYRPILSQIGDVPYLNGGLFEEDEEDKDGPLFPDAIIVKILSELVYQFNFTVTESTPLDVEVAVDPEMLGRIFEELVTGRHESGSYYTPKPVVAFMCREALKGYLETAMPSESAEVLALFVDQNDASGLRNPELALNALRAVKVCDPACGSGAYLLGMLHELLEQRESLFAAHVPDAAKIYDRKLEIIQNNLYGVDKDDFAVNIARLRLWLSLIVDFEGETPPPLPNLEFKIETGDSLTAPDPTGGLEPDMFRYGQVQEFLRLKNDFMSLHAGSDEKKKLGKQIDELRQKIKEWAHPVGRIGNPPQAGREAIPPHDSFDWQVEFAEVFAPELAQSTLSGRMAGIVNMAGGQMELTAAPKEGGFDIILANPPYVRHELLGDYKNLVKPIYPEIYNGLADLFVYFYGRAHQLLKKDGVSCFISSNKWLRAGYGEKLRQHLLDAQAFRLVVDFGELPVFQTAATFPAIFLWQKRPRNNTSTTWAVVKDLQECYSEGILEHVTRIAHVLPANQFGKELSRLTSAKNTGLRTKMETSGQRLGDLVGGDILYGIKTGLNQAFFINATIRNQLIGRNKNSERVIKPLIVGDDIRQYEIHVRGRYLLYIPWKLEIEKYPAVLDYLKRFKSKLNQRAEAAAGRHPWYALTRFASEYVEKFSQSKIIYPVIGKMPRFVMDTNGYFGNDKMFFIPSDDYYLLGVLNSSPAFEYLKTICSVLGDEMKGGRLEFRDIYVEKLPIPEVPQKERDAVANLAKQAQSLHTQRRARVETFLREIGLEPAQSNSRNPLETPWNLDESDFLKRARKYGTPDVRLYRSVREETTSVTDEIGKVEAEIDERVKALYGI
jgi:type I restriction-modification system DNA methylase subunit